MRTTRIRSGFAAALVLALAGALFAPIEIGASEAQEAPAESQRSSDTPERLADAPLDVAVGKDGRVVATLPNGARLATDPIPDRVVDLPAEEPPAPPSAADYWKTEDIGAPISDYEAEWRTGRGLDAAPSVGDFAKDPQAAFDGAMRVGVRLTTDEAAVVAEQDAVLDAIAQLHELSSLDGFAGIDFDPKALEVEVSVARGADAKSLRSYVVSNLPDGTKVNVREVDHSLDTLIAAAEEIGRRPGVKATSFDTQANEIIVYIESDEAFDSGRHQLSAEDRSAVERAGVPYRLDTMGSSVDTSCDQFTCPQGRRGGSDIGTPGGSCSTNFAYSFGPGDGRLGTNGHCVNVGDLISYGGVTSSFITHSWNRTPDFALVAWSGWGVGGRIYASASNPYQRIDSVQAPWTLVSNVTDICLAGRNSSATLCSKHLNYTFLDNTWYNFTTQSFSVSGDSGGAYYRFNVAQGVQKGQINVSGVLRDLGNPIWIVTAACGCSVVTSDLRPNELGNWQLNGSSPWGWVLRPAGTWGFSTTGGFSNERRAVLNCQGGTSGCSWYQDDSSNVVAGRPYGISTYVDCSVSTGCPVTLALWALGGSGGTDVRFISTTVYGRQYLATTVSFPGNHNSMRFEIYNNSSGPSISFSDPMLVDAS